MATNCNSDSNVITRFAIDCAGHLGSFYDAYRDCILGQLDVTSIAKSSQSFKSGKCQSIRGDKIKKLNLRLIGIEDELQLSILLNLTPKTEITSLIEYIHSLQEFTRILYFHYENSEQKLLENLSDFQRPNQSLMPQTSATHIITGVTWGINVVIILQLPSDDDTFKKIDDVLDKIQITLENDSSNLTLDTEEENILKAIISTKIYSNIPELTRMTTLSDIYRHIDQFKNSIINYPVRYTLRSITWLFPDYIRQGATFSPLPPVFPDIIQTNILPISSKIKNLEISLNDNLPKLLFDSLNKQIYEAQKQCSDIKKKYMKEIDRLSTLLISYRQGEIGVNKIKEALHDENRLALEKDINGLTENLKKLEKKGELLSNIQPFKYCNVVQRDIDENDTEKTVEKKLIIDEQHDRVLCTSDVLNKKNPEQLNKLRCKLMMEHEEDHFLRLIYADFSYSTFPLHDMIILPLSKTNIDQKSENTPSSTILKVSSNPNDIINILLLGETGVGKSTFINALANYLTFDSLERAESNKPVIIIPVSFIMTVGDHFQEYKIELDHTQLSNNENFNSFGQSVTQHCKSYILHLKNNAGKKLRIIDTPGFGDTRGSEQDDYNMQHILEYTNNLTHLNAICFLLKPNITRLNIKFQSCIYQLLNHLGSNAGENIIFCFTNARSTFYSPGNTAPLLKAMLSSLSMNNIPFKKDNTFCFDSEAFRYLVACLKNVSFNSIDKSEYEQSWLISMRESNRLIDYICKCLPIHCMQSEQQFIKHIQFEILHMIRPMLEAIRNILRNNLLCMSNIQNQSIELRPKSINRLTIQCLSCKPNPIRVGNFYVQPDLEHKIQNKCVTCPCTSNQHRPIEYLLEYECSTNVPNFDKMQGMLHSLLDASVKFAYFLISVSHFTKDDLFLISFHRMIEEEENICRKVQRNELNVQLRDQLLILLHGYKERMIKIKHTPWNNNLSAINDQIKTIMEYSIIHEQMMAIKLGQEFIMESS